MAVLAETAQNILYPARVSNNPKKITLLTYFKDSPVYKRKQDRGELRKNHAI